MKKWWTDLNSNVVFCKKNEPAKQKLYGNSILGLLVFVCMVAASIGLFLPSLYSSQVDAAVVQGGGSGSTTVNQDSIEEAAKGFYAYKALEECKNRWGTMDTSSFGVNLDESYANRQYGTFGGQTHSCTTSEMNSLIQEMNSSVKDDYLLDRLKQAAGRNDECDDDTYDGVECYNKLTTGQIREVLNDVLDIYQRYSDSGLSQAEWFWVWYTPFREHCMGDNFVAVGDDGSIPANPDEVWDFPSGSTLQPGEDGKLTIERVYANKADGVSGLLGEESFTVWPGNADTGIFAGQQGTTMTCGSIYDGVRDNFEAYVKALNASVDNGEEIPDDVVEGGTTSDGADDSMDSCEAGLFGFGWIFCPGQNLVEKIINGLMNWIADSMNWSIIANDSSSGKVRDVWQKFTTIANVCFVIAFLVMIYSMATSTGLSNYEIKKMLPRLIITAIAVNLSFYLCAALVDLSNILGKGAYDLITQASGTDTQWSIGNELAVDAFGVLAFIFFGGIAIVSIAIAFLAVTFRQILLVLLVVISPVALVLYMLPNTEKWSRKWFDMFVRMLMVYPMFTAVWGISHLASTVLQLTFGADDIGSAVMSTIISFVCAIAPAAAIVPIFKASGGLMAIAAGAMAGSALAKGSQKWINSKTRNNPASRLAARSASGAMNKLATSRLGRAPIIGNAIRRGAQNASNKAGQFGNSLNTIDDQLDAQSVERGKTANLGLTSTQVAEIARTGSYTNNRGKSVTVDSYQRRAAMDQVGDGMSYSDVESMLVNTANEASLLEAQGRTREAAALRESAYKAAKASGNALVSSGSLQDFRNGSGNWGNGNAQAAYDDAVSNYAGGLSVDQASKLSSKKHEHLQSKVSGSNAASYQNAIESAMNNAKAQSSMNQNTRDNLSNYLSQVRHANSNTAGTQTRTTTAGSGPSNINGSSAPTAQPAQRAAADPLNTNQRAAAGAAGGGVGVTTQSNNSAQPSQRIGGIPSNNGYQGKHFRQNTSGVAPTSGTIPSANNNPPIQGTPPPRP